jgi:hypothetical protein
METVSVGGIDEFLPIATIINRRRRFQSYTSEPIDLLNIRRATVR